jgi:hypothetical protein
LTQACYNPVGVRDLFAAQTENVGRAGELLIEDSSVFPGMNGGSATDRYRKAEDNSAGSHGPILVLDRAGVRVPSAKSWSSLQTKCGSGRFTQDNKM